jgi:hypothetical protein
LLKFNSDLVCAPCRHGKMIAASHSPVNTVMTEYPVQLLHMDTVGPSRVRSMRGKWYVLVIVDDYSRYSWVFFLESKDKVFEHFRSLALRLNNEHPNCLKVICSDNGIEFRNAYFDKFVLSMRLISSFHSARSSTEWSRRTKEPYACGRLLNALYSLMPILAHGYLLVILLWSPCEDSFLFCKSWHNGVHNCLNTCLYAL